MTYNAKIIYNAVVTERDAYQSLKDRRSGRWLSRIDCAPIPLNPRQPPPINYL